MKLIQETCEAFVKRLASKEPVPGGGGAAALVGSLGIALADMVGSLTVGKKKYADVQGEILLLKAEAERLEQRLLMLVEKDAEAFEPLSRAYGLPKETESEKKYKAIVMETALKTACDVPIEIMECVCKAIELTFAMSKIGTVIAISDAGCAAACLRGALTSASLNVFINTGVMQDRVRAGMLEQHAQEMLSQYIPLCDEIFESVLSRVKA